jgi:hypothetical protein
LERAVELRSTYTSKIDSVAQVVEAAQYQDEDLGAAWRNRMDASRAAHRAIIQRIADEGQLAEGSTVDTAGDLSYTLTMNGPRRELTQAVGWTQTICREHDQVASPWPPHRVMSRQRQLNCEANS